MGRGGRGGSARDPGGKSKLDGEDHALRFELAELANHFASVQGAKNV